MKLESTSINDLHEIANKLNLEVNIFRKYELPKINKMCNNLKFTIVLTGEKNQSLSHWVCFAQKGKQTVYFDSFGLAPPKLVLKYLKRTENDKIPYSANELQDRDAYSCGHFCILFCFFMRDYYKPYVKLTTLLNQFCALFSKTDKKQNERLIESFFRKL